MWISLIVSRLCSGVCNLGCSPVGQRALRAGAVYYNVMLGPSLLEQVGVQRSSAVKEQNVAPAKVFCNTVLNKTFSIFCLEEKPPMSY